MKYVYLVWDAYEFLGEYGFESDYELNNVFDSKEKAKKYIESLYPEAKYDEKMETYYLTEKVYNGVGEIYGLGIEERKVL